MTVFYRTLLDQNSFAGPPNEGHLAAADLLLVRGIQTAITTNVDTLIETAGQLLLGQVGVGIEVPTIATLPPDTSPLLKIHGCRQTDQANMVWAPGQLAVPPVSTRIADSAAWLNVRLLDRDLLVVGYWTDWDYLNAVLARTLGAVSPSSVIVVNPTAASSLAVKAPELYALGQRAKVSFAHVAASGAEFLDHLRLKFSRSFLRAALHSGATDFTALVGIDAKPEWLEPPTLDNFALWSIRRDLEGRAPNEPARDLRPPAETLMGLTLLQLQSHGAVAEGQYWVIGGVRVRLLRAGNKLLHRVEAEHARETAPAIAPDIVVAVGAESHGLPANIARAEPTATIARGNASRWLTRQEALQELGI